MLDSIRCRCVIPLSCTEFIVLIVQEYSQGVVSKCLSVFVTTDEVKVFELLGVYSKMITIWAVVPFVGVVIYSRHDGNR